MSIQNNNPINTNIQVKGPSAPSTEKKEQAKVSKKQGWVSGRVITEAKGKKLSLTRTVRGALKSLSHLFGKPPSLRDKRVAHIKLDSIGARRSLKQADKLLSRSEKDNKALLQKLKTRKPGQGMVDSAKSELSDKDLIKQGRNRANSDRSVRVALNEAHDILDTEATLKAIKKNAKKDPKIVDGKKLQEVEQKLKDIKPLARKVNQALRNPEGINLFDRLYLL